MFCDWKRGDWLSLLLLSLVGMESSSGLIAGLRGFCEHWVIASKVEGQANRFSGSGESSVLSHEFQLSVVAKPNELADRAGDSGDRGEAAESEVKSVPKSSGCSKTEIGEKSYVCCRVLAPVFMNPSGVCDVRVWRVTEQ